MSKNYDFILDATPGAREAIAASDKAVEARAAIVLTYPPKTRPFQEISRFVPGLDSHVREPLPTVEAEEFDRARVASARHDAAVKAADRAVESAQQRALGLIYGALLDNDARAARQVAADARVAQIDETIATVPLLANDVAAMRAERIVAERFALIPDPKVLMTIATIPSATVTTNVRDADGHERTIKVSAEGIQSIRGFAMAPQLTEADIRRANR